jgi:hypothetical protein
MSIRKPWPFACSGDAAAVLLSAVNELLASSSVAKEGDQTREGDANDRPFCREESTDHDRPTPIRMDLIAMLRRQADAERYGEQQQALPGRSQKVKQRSTTTKSG